MKLEISKIFPSYIFLYLIIKLRDKYSIIKCRDKLHVVIKYLNNAEKKYKKLSIMLLMLTLNSVYNASLKDFHFVT